MERVEAGERALHYVLDRLFQGSPKALMTSLVANDRIDEEELAELSRVLERRSTG